MLECWSVRPPASLREALRAGVLEYCAKSELHPRSGLGMLMAENGVIFSDGIESDFLQFNSGSIAAIQPANRKGVLVVG